MSDPIDSVFAALADPTRRAILAMLLEDDMAVTDVAEPFEMSLAAISKHLVDGDLMRAAEEIGADLIVVGTHAPRITDYIFSSHAGYLAKHASVSVFVVR